MLSASDSSYRPYGLLYIPEVKTTPSGNRHAKFHVIIHAQFQSTILRAKIEQISSKLRSCRSGLVLTCFRKRQTDDLLQFTS